MENDLAFMDKIQGIGRKPDIRRGNSISRHLTYLNAAPAGFANVPRLSVFAFEFDPYPVPVVGIFVERCLYENRFGACSALS